MIVYLISLTSEEMIHEGEYLVGKTVGIYPEIPFT